MTSNVSTPPNILLIHADQHRYDCVGCNGHPLLQTPNLDRLAAEGVNFTHAFCPIPLCAPSRTSLLTGVWPVQHGCIANAGTEAGATVRPQLTTFSQVLRQAGYALSYIGKWHEAGRTPLDYGFDHYVAERDYGAWRQGQGLPPRPQQNRWFGEVDPYITPAQSRLAWGAQQAMAALEAASVQAQPFFIRWDPGEPHLPNVVPEPYASLYPPAQIAPWPSFPDRLCNKPFIQQQQRRTWGLADWTWADWAPIVSRYLGEITLLDHQIGRVLARLDALGLAENTLVIYAADHGDLCGGHGMIDKHFVMYEELVRVPLILRWSAGLPAGLRNDGFVCAALDLAATFCDAARMEAPAHFVGQSLLPIARGEQSSQRRHAFASYHGNQFGLYSQRMVRDRRWKLVWNATAEDELYDLESDPGELTNLAGASECADVLADLRQNLVAWMDEINDPLLNEWTRRQLILQTTIPQT
ncbi:MAG: sulfatase-like hydrolase/transferase [Caldilineaceae bacterium]